MVDWLDSVVVSPDVKSCSICPVVDLTSSVVVDLYAIEVPIGKAVVVFLGVFLIFLNSTF